MQNFNPNHTFEMCLEKHYKYLVDKDIMSKEVKVAVPKDFDIKAPKENAQGRCSHIVSEQLFIYLTYFNELYKKFNADNSMKLDYITVSNSLYEALNYYNLVMEE